DRKKVERLEALVRKFEQIARARPDPSWGKRLRAQRSRLARAKDDATNRPDIGNRDAKVNFQGEASKADLAIAIVGYSKSFDEKCLFSDASFTVLNGERVALVGPNGSGKTSFLRDLIRTGSWDDPVIRVGPSMRVGYCAQDQGVFDPVRTVEEAFLEFLPTRRDVFAHLGAFLFSYDDLDKRCGSLSGGELNRLQLARASALKANLLVLDEPTNHLDIPTREAVEDALDDFEGTVLAVSHDRYFLEKIADRVVFVEDRHFVEYEGSFLEYWRDVGSLLPRPGAGIPVPGGTARTTLEDRGRSRMKSPNANSTITEKERDIEFRIATLERRREELERMIADAIESRKFAESKHMAKDLERNNALLDKLWKQFAG
ncbi:MAG: ABC-F family ATP-binding cassette domain-containing protein, partial [Spirochaetales bacterium]